MAGQGKLGRKFLEIQVKYLQGNADLMADMSALFCGFNPKRIFNTYLFAGVGLNHAFDNDEANALYDKGLISEYLWSGSKNSVPGRFGLGFDFRLSDRVALNLEGNANLLSDKFNSKKADNCDWQFNALVGLTVKFGKSHKKVMPVPQVVEPVAVEPVPEPVPVRTTEVKEEVKAVVAEPEEVKEEMPKQDIFFALNSSQIRESERAKIAELVDYLKRYPETKVSLTGYADAATGNPQVNLRLSKERANHVAAALQAAGIAADRIITDFKGDTMQPYATPKENRVVICITR